MMPFAAAHDTFPGDIWLTQRLQDADGEAIDHLLRWGSRLVEWPYWGVVALAGSLYALWAAGPPIAPVIVLGLIARFLNNMLKDIVERPRPSSEQVHVDGVLSTSSFPSGHAYNAVILYGLIFFVATEFIPSKWIRRAVQAACVAVTIWTCIDRVYSGYHWPSDVVGGYLSGIVILGLLVLLGLWLTGRWQPSLPGRTR